MLLIFCYCKTWHNVHLYDWSFEYGLRYFYLRSVVSGQNPYEWFFRSDHQQLQKIYLARLKGASCPPQTKYGTQPVHWTSIACGSQGPKLLWPVLFLCLFVFLAKALSFLDCSVWGFWQVFFGCLCWGLFTRRGRGNLEDTFPHSE